MGGITTKIWWSLKNASVTWCLDDSEIISYFSRTRTWGSFGKVYHKIKNEKLWFSGRWQKLKFANTQKTKLLTFFCIIYDAKIYVEEWSELCVIIINGSESHLPLLESLKENFTVVNMSINISLKDLMSCAFDASVLLLRLHWGKAPKFGGNETWKVSQLRTFLSFLSSLFWIETLNCEMKREIPFSSWICLVPRKSKIFGKKKNFFFPLSFRNISLWIFINTFLCCFIFMIGKFHFSFFRTKIAPV